MGTGTNRDSISLHCRRPLTVVLLNVTVLTSQTPSVPSEEAGPFNGAGMGRQGGNNMMPGPPMGELMAGRGGSFPSDFRPNGRAIGFEVRLVTKDSKHRSGDPVVLCFVDFENPACAATALSALQETQVQDQDNVEEEGDQFYMNPNTLNHMLKEWSHSKQQRWMERHKSPGDEVIET
ncbi:unnamed protein product [Arabidopsis lyrata]|nr:unnamed protein product [Arabidopsis lyrata]